MSFSTGDQALEWKAEAVRVGSDQCAGALGDVLHWEQVTPSHAQPLSTAGQQERARPAFFTSLRHSLSWLPFSSFFLPWQGLPGPRLASSSLCDGGRWTILISSPLLPTPVLAGVPTNSGSCAAGVPPTALCMWGRCATHCAASPALLSGFPLDFILTLSYIHHSASPVSAPTGCSLLPFLQCISGLLLLLPSCIFSHTPFIVKVLRPVSNTETEQSAMLCETIVRRVSVKN